MSYDIASPLRILQVNTTDARGGAARVAWNLFQAYRMLGYFSWLAVGHKDTDDPEVLLIPNDDYRRNWARMLIKIGWAVLRQLSRIRGSGRLKSVLCAIGEPRRWAQQEMGREDLTFPGTWHLLELRPNRPQIVHCHNLHGGYFDLRILPWLSSNVPVVLTLHDAWLLSGHCAHSLDCVRWKSGCGRCPYLSLRPAIKRDASAFNWQRKREILSRSRLYVATPSQWLMDRVRQSILAAGMVEGRVIPNGVDLAVFRPNDRQSARHELGLPQDAYILLFVANDIRDVVWKDYVTLRKAIAEVAEHIIAKNVLFVALGEEAPMERIGRAAIRFVPYCRDAHIIARYYQAANLYLHAAHADTFPNTILEAIACGTPVVATAVGGIPEQVKSMHLQGYVGDNYDLAYATGCLTAPGDAVAMARCIVTVLTNEDLQAQLARNAARDARDRFDLKQQVNAYLSWYREIIEQFVLNSSVHRARHALPDPS